MSSAVDEHRGPDPLPIALRVFAEPTGSDIEPPTRGRRRRGRGRHQREDQFVLVLDTETTIDRAQRLTFGVYRYYRTRRAGGKLTCLDEGIFHADELPDTNPDGYRLLCDYARYREPAVDWTPGDEFTKDAPTQIRLLTETNMRELLYVAGFKNRAMVVCFNFPFDLSRLALDWAATRGGRTRAEQRASSFQGGFTLRFAEHDGKPNRFRPELWIKTIDSKRALKRYTTPNEVESHEIDANGLPFQGHLLDLRTIAFALTDRGYTLEGACAAFGVPYTKREVEHGQITMEYIDYCREDVQATARLYEAISTEFRRHPIQLQITKAFSPASIGKSYLKAMGIKPRFERQPDFPREVLGYAMSAYYGGRAECRIRRTAVPVVYVDFLSMYPTVNALMGFWEHVIASRIEPVDATDEIRTLLEHITLEDCLDPTIWRELPALVQINPNGDVLPVRARYGTGPSLGIGSNPLHSDQPMWFALPDVIASKLITGRPPQILHAIRLTPTGRQRGLKAVKLRGQVEIDPRHDDLFKAAIEHRRQQTDKSGPVGKFLKTFANGTSYGIYAEMIRHELPASQKQQVTVYSEIEQPYVTDISAPEHPGEFAFPPMAACITAAARLMLAILETLVTRAGGSWAVCDTDSMAIVATKRGGLIPCPGGLETDRQGRSCARALSFDQVDEIVRQFEALNPYDSQLVPGSVLEVEAENYGPDRNRHQLYCYAISAKRYALYTLNNAGSPVLRLTKDGQEEDDPDRFENGSGEDQEHELRKHSEHGLGHLINPTDPDSNSRDWTRQIWQHIIETDALHQDSHEPEWLDRPALTRTTITSPRLIRPFEKYNRTRPLAERIRPYNFLLIAHATNPGLQGLDGVLLVAPFETDPRKWQALPWTNARQPGERWTIIPDNGQPDQLASATHGRVIVKTYRTVLNDYRTHPESKSLGPDGKPCTRATIGLLDRRPVKVAGRPHHIGKESNKIEDVQTGLVGDLDEVLIEYRNPEQDHLWELVVKALNTWSVRSTAATAGVSERTLKRARAGVTIGKASRAKLSGYVIQQAQVSLRAARIHAPINHEALLTTYLATLGDASSA